MTLLVLAALAAVIWGWRRRRLGRMRVADMVAGMAVLAGAMLLRRGTELPALLLIAGAGLYGWRRLRVPAPVAPDEAADARTLLELPPHADAQAIRAAHRRLITRVHPDAGGNAELARRVNRARDVLLAAAAPRHS